MINKIIKGQGVSKGKAEGEVVILTDLKNRDKVDNDKILVTNILKLDLDLLDRIIGVITEEGGATCHIAIRCRELDIPCIVGTKDATKVIKDGDKVKLDANEGIVKII